MTPFTLGRRHFLKGLGGVAIALPTLEAMFDKKAAAQGMVDPKRYVCMYIASGTYLKQNDGAFWYPGTTSAPLSAAALPAVFAPFPGNAGDFSIIRGLRNKARYQCQGQGGDHSTAIATFLTSTPYTNGDDGSCTINGSSFDQAIAQKNGLTAYAMSASGYDGYHADSTPFDYSRTVSYLNGQQADCWLNPYKLYQTLFANLQPQATAPPTPLLVKNKSILDSATAGITKLKTKLGTSDKARVDDYFSGLRSVEASLQQQMPPPPSQCVPGAGVATSLNNEDHDGTGTDFGARLKAFFDIMVLSFKCNSAQVYSFMFEYENTNRQFRNQIPSSLVYQGANMDTPGSHNEIAHWADGGTGEETERRNRCVSRDRYYVSQMMYLVNQLKLATDPSGASLLDNTIIHMGNGLEDGNHNLDGMDTTTGLPNVVAGGKKLGLSPGNFYMMAGKDMSDLYFTLNQKLGMGMANWAGSTAMLGL
jgi:hypothetical protein